VDYEQLTIRQWQQFELAYAVPASLTEIMGDVTSLHSLLTLCTDGPSAIDSVDLYRPDYPDRVLSGNAIPGPMQKIELRAAFIGSGSRTQQKRREPQRMLVSFGDIGAIETAANWLNEAPRLKIIVGSLVTMGADSIFGENRFLNVCSAAEGFHRSTIGGSHMDKAEFKSIKKMLKNYLPRRYREWFDSRMAHANDPSLNQRLKQLADPRTRTFLRPVRAEACLGPHRLFLWPVGELEAELFVQLGLVGRVGMSEHVEVVVEAGDDPGDLVAAHADASGGAPELRFGFGALGLRLGDPPGDHRGVVVVIEGVESLQRGAMPGELAVAFGDLLAGQFGSGVGLGVLGGVEVVDELGRAAGREHLDEPAV
jgi:hypothetical protein